MNAGIQASIRFRTIVMLLLALPLLGASASAANTSVASHAEPVTGPVKRNAQHDFDFEFGTWKAHIRRLQHPLTGSKEWVEYDGSSIVRKVWGGRANLGELDVSGSAGRIEGLSLRLYNPQTDQWAVSWANSRDGNLTVPLTGRFEAGRGEFYSADTLDGRAIFARFIFSDIKTTSFQIEQAFSGDGGKTWETNWIATFNRVSTTAAVPSPRTFAPPIVNSPPRKQTVRGFLLEEGIGYPSREQRHGRVACGHLVGASAARKAPGRQSAVFESGFVQPAPAENVGFPRDG